MYPCIRTRNHAIERTPYRAIHIFHTRPTRPHSPLSISGTIAPSKLACFKSSTPKQTFLSVSLLFFPYYILPPITITQSKTPVPSPILPSFCYKELEDKMKCYSEEADSRSCGELKKQKKTAEEEESRRGGGKGGDGSSSEVVKRRRGRPLGSKNKPQPPVVITREFTDSSSAMRPHVLEISAGRDVAAALAAFSRRRALGLCVLAAAGTVAKVTLRQSSLPVEGSPSAASVVTLGGPFEILSMSGTFFPPSLPAGGGGGVFSVSLAGPQGRVVGGMVVGPLVAAGTVMVVAAAFSQPTFHRLPVEEEEAGSASASLSGGGGGGDEVAAHPRQDEDDRDEHDEEVQYHYQHHHYHDHHHHGSSAGTPIYAGPFPPDVLWTPPAGSPHPPPPPPYRFT